MNRAAIIKLYAENHTVEDTAKLILLFAKDREWSEGSHKRDELGRFAKTGATRRPVKRRNREYKETKRTIPIRRAGNGKLDGYSDHQKADWANSKAIVVCENDKAVQGFIDNARADKQNHSKMYMGRIDSKTAGMIRKNTGIDVEGFNLAIGADEIRKIDSSHGDATKEALRGQLPVTTDDYKLLPTIIADADSVTLDSEKYNGSNVLIFKKKLNRVTTAVTYVSLKRKDLRLQTMYINKK